MIDEATKLAKQFEGEMVLVETVFTTMKMLEILVDAANFYDLQTDGNPFDAGTFAGKGLINAGFNTYQVVMDNFVTPMADRKAEEEAVITAEEYAYNTSQCAYYFIEGKEGDYQGGIDWDAKHDIDATDPGTGCAVHYAYDKEINWEEFRMNVSAQLDQEYVEDAFEE